MCFYHFALAADDLLGRVDIHSLSQQTIMEIFADGLAEKLKKYFKMNMAHIMMFAIGGS